MLMAFNGLLIGLCIVWVGVDYPLPVNSVNVTETAVNNNIPQRNYYEEYRYRQSFSTFHNLNC